MKTISVTSVLVALLGISVATAQIPIVQDAGNLGYSIVDGE